MPLSRGLFFFCGSSDYCVSFPYADRWGRSECSKCTAVQGAPMGPVSSLESPSGPVKNGWGRGICITVWRPSPHCCTHVHSVEQQQNKASLCTAGLITHSGPERAPGMSNKVVMEFRLQITKAKMEIPSWKCKVPQTPSVPWQNHSWVIYTQTLLGHFPRHFCLMESIDAMFHIELTKSPVNISADVPLILHGCRSVYLMCVFIWIMSFVESLHAIRCICSLSNVSWTIFKQLFLCESEIFQMLADVTLKIVMRSRWCTYWPTSWVIPSYIL